ncbi:hypothetical protein ACJJTC_012661 [Scirpophaga incertulas]
MASGLIQFAFVLASGIINIMPNERVEGGEWGVRGPFVIARGERRGGKKVAAGSRRDHKNTARSRGGSEPPPTRAAQPPAPAGIFLGALLSPVYRALGNSVQFSNYF